jgi:subtilase family serine protease
VVYARGVQPAFDELWALEGALDSQWAHAIAQGADILLVEASSNNFIDLFQAVDVTTNLGATVVSMSWGGPEFPLQVIFEPLLDHAGVTFIAGAGDDGHEVNYPAASPFVVAVGGTRLPLDKKGNRTGSETAWIASGGGISQFFPEPAYQYTYPIPDTFGYRGIPDVAYNADPATGISVYDSHGLAGETGWLVVAGTSAGGPQWAGLIALANELRDGDNLSSNNVINSPIYDAARHDYRDNFFDIKSGSNGACGAICTAVKGYDFVTGLGSPRADQLVEALAEQ